MLRSAKINLIPQKIRFVPKTLFILCLMLFSWTLFDGVVSIAVPQIITQGGFSKTMLGIIIGTSSIFGAIFDFLLSKFLNNTHFRRVYLLMFAVCFIFPLLLRSAKSFWLFLVVMAIWGFYYDLFHFGNFDFVGRKIEPNNHTKSFGIIEIFKSLGYMVAPLIVDLVILSNSHISSGYFLLMFFFLSISLVFYLFVLKLTKDNNQDYIQKNKISHLNVLKEFGLWKKIGKILFPVLILTMFLNIFDSFFWTLGPIFTQSQNSANKFNGLFLTAYTFPTILVGWIIGSVTTKYGKKKIAFLFFLIGSVILSLFTIISQPLFLLVLVFISSVFVSSCFPAINGTYADYIAESSSVEKEIEALSDFFSNLGYIIGPIMAGFLADRVGNAVTFSFLGIICALISVILLLKTPERINVRA